MLNASLRALRSMIAIDRHGKISSAAPLLRLTPSAVTLQVKQLEEQAGVALFDRTPTGMKPTTAGEAVIATAVMIEEHLRALADTLDAIKGVRKGSLRLGVVSTAKYFAPGLMAAFKATHPDIDLSLNVGNRAEIIESLKALAVDVAIMGRPPRSLPVRSSVFGDHPLVIVSAPDHPLAHERGIAKRRVAAEEFIVRERGSGTRTSMETFMRDIPGWLDRDFSEMDSNETIKQAVMAGLGIAFISGHTVVSEIQTGRLTRLDVEGMPIRRQWFAVTRGDRTPTPVMAAFNTFLVSEGAAHLKSLNALYAHRPHA